MPSKVDYDKDLFIKLHSQGLSDRNMAVHFGVHHGTIGKWRRDMNLSVNGYDRTPITMITDTEAECSRCGYIQPLDNFVQGKSHVKPYYYSYCKYCWKQRHKDNLNNNLMANIKDRYNRTKKRAEESNVYFDLKFYDFFARYSTQNGRCFYFGTEMDIRHQGFAAGMAKRCSVDKIIPEKGYTYGNFVFCSTRANTMKSNLTLEEMRVHLPGWYEKIINHLNKFGVQYD